MHKNRELYTLDQYQRILLSRWHSTIIWLGKHNEKGSPELWFCRPVPRTIWLPGKPREKYYRALREKLKSTMTRTAKKYSFLTLTYSSRLYSPEEACAQLKGDIKELLRRLRRRLGKLQYFYIVELTKSGYPHLHVIIDHFIFWKVLKAMWFAITGSYIVDIRSIPAGNIASYICKYLTKQSKHTDWQFSFIFKNISRLWAASRGFFGKYQKPLNDCIFLAMSWSCDYYNHVIHRPDNESTFWWVPYEFAIPLLAYDVYLPRKRSPEGQSFLYELYDMFPWHLIRECFALCDQFYHYSSGKWLPEGGSFL